MAIYKRGRGFELKQIQLVVRVGLELGSSGLQVQHSDRSATPPPTTTIITTTTTTTTNTTTTNINNNNNNINNNNNNNNNVIIIIITTTTKNKLCSLEDTRVFSVGQQTKHGDWVHRKC